jgi:hypothetical protein
MDHWHNSGGVVAVGWLSEEQVRAIEGEIAGR